MENTAMQTKNSAGDLRFAESPFARHAPEEPTNLLRAPARLPRDTRGSIANIATDNGARSSISTRYATTASVAAESVTNSCSPLGSRYLYSSPHMMIRGVAPHATNTLPA